MTVRFHLFPFRTQQLSSLVPKIVSWKRLVKIGSRRLEYAALRVLRAVFLYPRKESDKMELLKIETQRLLLRQFAIGDAEDVFAILSDEQTTLDCGGYHAFKEMDEEYERLMQKFAAQTRYSIVCRETGRVIGMMSMMDAERAVPGWEFGIEIAPDARRRGYAREALQAVVQTYFEKTDAEMFTGGHYAYNLASGQLMKAVGFQYEGVEHKAMRHATRGATDLVCYYIEKG